MARSNSPASPGSSSSPSPRRKPSPGGGSGRRRIDKDGYISSRQNWLRNRKLDHYTPGPDANIIRAEHGTDLAHYLSTSLPGDPSVRAVRRLLEQRLCLVNGQIETYGSRRLARGDVVEVLAGGARDDEWHEFDAARVLHDAWDVVAYDKPPRCAVVPTDNKKMPDLHTILNKNMGGKIIAVHRLDADTSGIVLFARTPKMARFLEAAFKEHQVQKTYQALVRGMPKESGEHRSYLVKVAEQVGFEVWRSGRGPDAKQAITTWKVEEVFGRVGSLVKVLPKTGRYHQIRIHFAELGHSLLGDRQYGDRQDPVPARRQLLHASAITVNLPEDENGVKHVLQLNSPLPEDFKAAIKGLRRVAAEKATEE